jgi:hypothetical protein
VFRLRSFNATLGNILKAHPGALRKPLLRTANSYGNEH